MRETPPSAPPHRPRKFGSVALGSLVPEAVAPILRERGFASSAILTEWREIVGPRLAQWTSPVEIRWPRRAGDAAMDREKSKIPEKSKTLGKLDAPGGPPPGEKPAYQPRPSRTRSEQATRATLIVACPGAFALDVQMSAPAIIEAVNRRLGFGCIGAIQIHQAPRPAPKPAPVSRNLDPALVAKVDSGLADIEHQELRRALALLGAEIAARGRP